MGDISNRTSSVPQSYSKSGIISKKNINTLGKSINDLEARDGIRIDRNPVGGHIFYPPADIGGIYHYKLYDPVDYTDLEHPATVKMRWGAWCRSSKYTFSRRVLITDIVDGVDQPYKTVNLTKDKLNWVYVELKAPPELKEESSTSSIDKDDPQYLEPFNKPYSLEVEVKTSTPVNYSDINFAVPNYADPDNTLFLIGMINVDAGGKITWIEQCWRGGDIDDVASFYEGPFKLEAAGKGGKSQTAALTTPLYNTHDPSTGDITYDDYPFGHWKANQVIVGQGNFYISEGQTLEMEWLKYFRTLDLSDTIYKGKQVFVNLKIKLRNFHYKSLSTKNIEDLTIEPVINISGTTPWRNHDSYIRYITLGFVWLDLNGNIIEMVQLQHGDIHCSKYDRDFAAYYIDQTSANIQNINFNPGYIFGPFDSFNFVPGTALNSGTIPIDLSLISCPQNQVFKFLVYLETTIDEDTGEIETDTDKTLLKVANDYDITINNGSWTDFVQELHIFRKPIGAVVCQFNSNDDKWEITDWEQMQYGPIYLNHYCITSYVGTKHYTGMLQDCWDDT